MIRSNLYSFILILVIAIITAGCSGGGSDSEETSGDAATEGSGDKITLTIIHDTTEDHIKGVGSLLFKDLVEERLGDKVEVEIHPNSTLFDVEEGTEALQAGNIHMVISASSKLIGFDPAYQLYDMPFLFDSLENFYEFDESEIGQELRSRVEDYDLKILDTWAGSFKQITNSERPISKPEDMENLKFRVMAGGLLEDQFTTLGAGATVIPFGDLYMSLQQGMIDGQENSYLEIDSAKIYEVQNYMTVTNHAPTTYPLLTNKEFWEGLPDDIRTELEDILAEVKEVVIEEAKEVEQASYDVIVEEGDMEIIELSDEEREAFREALEPLYDKYNEIFGDDLVYKALDFN